MCYDGKGTSQVKSRPTQRAANGGYAARFLSIFLALGFVPFRRRGRPLTHQRVTHNDENLLLKGNYDQDSTNHA